MLCLIVNQMLIHALTHCAGLTRAQPTIGCYVYDIWIVKITSQIVKVHECDVLRATLAQNQSLQITQQHVVTIQGYGKKWSVLAIT